MTTDNLSFRTDFFNLHDKLQSHLIPHLCDFPVFDLHCLRAGKGLKMSNCKYFAQNLSNKTCKQIFKIHTNTKKSLSESSQKYHTISGVPGFCSSLPNLQSSIMYFYQVPELRDILDGFHPFLLCSS